MAKTTPTKPTIAPIRDPNTPPAVTTPTWGDFTGGEIDPNFETAVGTFGWDPAAPYGTGGHLYDPSLTTWSPESFYGKGGPWDFWATDYREATGGAADPFSLSTIRNFYADSPMVGNPWEEMAFKTGLGPGNYEEDVKSKMQEYKTGVASILQGYYGADLAADYMANVGTTEGGWIPTPISGEEGEYGAFETAIAGATITKGEGVLGEYYRQWDKYDTDVIAGEGGALDVTGTDSVWHELQKGNLTYSDDAGDQVENYFKARKGALQPFFGTGTTALEGWDADSPLTITPMAVDPDTGTSVEVTIDSSNEHIEAARTKYTAGSRMRAHIDRIAALKLQKGEKETTITAKEAELGLYGVDLETGEVDRTAEGATKWAALDLEKAEFQPIDDGSKYDGLYEGQRTILQGLFGEGDHVIPGLGSPLATARENITTVANKWHTETGFGEDALSTAIVKTTLDSAGAADAWDLAMEGASQGFFGIGDFTKQDLITAGFIDGDYNLQYDPTANSANEATVWNNVTTDVKADALEGESELAYQLRTQFGQFEEGQLGIYDNAYEGYVDDRIENLETAHKDFQADFEGAASAFAQGNIELKDKVAAQKGLRSGTVKRVRQQLEQGIAETYGEDKLDWEDFKEQEKINFDNNIELISNNLVNAWEGQFGDAGTLDQQEGTRDMALGQIFGTYDYTDADGVVHTGQAHTASSILATMQGGFEVGGAQTVTADWNGDGIPTSRNITTQSMGDYGTAFNNHRTDKLGLFGKLDKSTGYSPGPDGKFGEGGDDEWYVGFADPDADEYGWKKGNIPDSDLAVYAGVKLPTDVGGTAGEGLEDYATGGVFGTGLRDWMGTYSTKLGGVTAAETGQMTADDIVAASTTTPATEAEKYATVTGGEFGKVKTDMESEIAKLDLKEPGIQAEADIAYGEYGELKGELRDIESGVGTSLDTKFYEGPGSMLEKFGEDPQSELNKIQSFKDQKVEADSATMNQWAKMFQETNATSIHTQLKSLRDSVSGEAGDYMDFLQEQLNDPESGIGGLMGADWAGYTPEGESLVRIANNDPSKLTDEQIKVLKAYGGAMGGLTLSGMAAGALGLTASVAVPVILIATVIGAIVCWVWC